MSNNTCTPITLTMSQRFQNTEPAFGGVKFGNRLENVWGMKVRAATITSGGSTGTGAELSQLFTLRSSVLSGMCARQNHWIASNNMNDHSSTALPRSTAIAVFGVYPAIPSTTYGTVQLPDIMSAAITPFSRIYHIDSFDWTVEPVRTPLAMTADYTVEFIIEFYVKD